MSDETAKTSEEPAEASGASASTEADAIEQCVGESIPAPPGEPIEAEFEPADSVWKRLTDRQVSMPIALGLAGAAAVVGGFFGVVFDGGGPSAGQVEAAVERQLAPFDERLRNLRQTITESGEGGGVAAAALADLEAELAATRQSVSALENRVRVAESSRGGGEANAELAAQLEELQTDIVEARRLAEEALAAPSAQSAELDALAARLTALSETARAQGRAIEQLSEASSVLVGRVTGVTAPLGLATAGAAATLAFSNLQDAALSGGSFAVEAAKAQDYFADSEDMAALAALAENGAPTPAALAASFRSAARAAREAEQPAGGGVVERLGQAVASLVTVRRLDAPETDSVGDVIVRAQARLAADDLAGAAAELDRLEGAQGEAVETWIAQARARVEIESRLEALRSSFSER